MTNILSGRTIEFNKTIKNLSLASWNRPRSSNELKAFVSRRQAALEAANL